MKIILPYIVPHDRKNDLQAQVAQQQMIERLQRLRERSSAAYDQLHSEIQDPEKHREKPMTGWAELELEKITGHTHSGRMASHPADWSIHLFTRCSNDITGNPQSHFQQTAALL